ncbi:hypothetical protein CMI47_00515 [Candidatus Pacearchaeota archaeon]|nr:hypothetical protein [Candidatus Pacearchaeota archaeon]|tara:strand:+ start:4577 stop:5152 length:576 start_codon:yes stop_codon:yes gene_type:complete
MPNWCDDTLRVAGPEDEVQRFKRKANGPIQTYNDFFGGDWVVHDDIRIKAQVKLLPDVGEISKLSFHALVPVPEDYRRFPYDSNRAREVGELVGEERKCGGYEWESANWGVKWGASDVDLLDEESEYLCYKFMTPWGPPVELLNNVSQEFPKLEFTLEYSESGMGFAGQVVWYDGEMQSEEEWTIEEEEEE